MKNLKEIQKNYTQAILRGDLSSLEEWIIPGGQLSSKGALEVYKNGYHARMTEALGETYEAIWWTLGDELFFETCKDYVTQTPSSFYNLSNYGKSFPEFLKTQNAINDLPFIYDLALFEWKFKELFHKKYEKVLVDPKTPSANSQFIFTNACFLFYSPFAIYDIWAQREKPITEIHKIDLHQAQWLFAKKRGNEIYISQLSEPQFELYKSLKRGEPLSEALENLSRKFEDTNETLVSLYFQELMGAEVLLNIIN